MLADSEDGPGGEDPVAKRQGWFVGLVAKLWEYKSDLDNVKSELKRISAPNARQATREELLEAGMADTLAVSSWTPINSLTLVHQGVYYRQHRSKVVFGPPFVS